MKTGQSYVDWAAELCGLARHCAFTCKSTGCGTSYVDEQIRDIIIKETPHADVRRQCLLDADPSLNDVLKKATAFIKTTETDKILKGETTSPAIEDTVNKMSGQYKQRSRRGQQTIGKQQANAQNTGMLKSCPSCYIKHDRKNCPCRAFVCRKCEVKGHIEAVCMAKTAAQSQTEQSARTVENSVLSVLTDASEPYHSVHAVSDNLFQRVNRKVWIKTVVNGHDAMFQWDTGATCSIVDLQGYQSLGSPPSYLSVPILKRMGRVSYRLKDNVQLV